jgi:hypothetical protein
MRFNRFIRGIFCLIIVVPCGWMTLGVLDHHCDRLVIGECRLLWLTAIVAFIGGIVIIEILIARQKARGEWPAPPRQAEEESPFSSHLWIWARPLDQVLLMSLIASLSVVIQGAFVLTVLGLIVGVFTDGLIRAILNRLPPRSSG